MSRDTAVKIKHLLIKGTRKKYNIPAYEKGQIIELACTLKA